MKICYVEHHPAQYRAGLLRLLAKKVDLTVFYSSLQGAQLYRDSEFKTAFAWDTSVLEGYRWEAVWPTDLLWRLREFDAVIVHGINYPINWAAFLGAWLWRKRLFLRGEFVRTRWIHRWLFKHVTGILAIGAVARNAALAAEVSEDRIFWTPYAIDTEWFSMASAVHNRANAIRLAFGWPSNLPIVLFSGKLIPRKHPMDLLSACQGLDCLDCAVLFVGDGPLRPLLEARIREQKMCAGIAGFVNQSKMPGFYAAADVLVLPSDFEPYGLVASEAMACGLPIILSSGVAAATDLVRDNGYVYPAGNIAMLRLYLKTLLGSPTLRATMGARSREIIKEFSIESSVKGIMEALHT